jgi:surface protein
MQKLTSLNRRARAMRNHPGKCMVALVGCLGAWLGGCDGETTAVEKPVAEVAVSPPSVTLAVGQTQQLTATTRDGDGNVLTGRPVTWSATNTSVATVSEGGLVTGVGSGTATVTASSEGRSGSASVTVPEYALAVTKAGTGSGRVTSSPGGIDCGAACGSGFASGTPVTLTAAPDEGSVFAEWSGACTGSGSTCQVTMDGAKSVTATFTRLYTLTVTKVGTGSGTVASSPAGIDCGGACEASFASGTGVTLTATADEGSVFQGWGGACAGSADTCSVTMDGAKSVTATFSRLYPLTVTKAGTGTGTVSSSPAGIACGESCEASFASGTGVTLTATADEGSVFQGWGGACTGSADTCSVTMDGAKEVTATFNEIIPAFVTIWDTNLGAGTRIALALAGQVNATIDWGDGNTRTVTLPGPHRHDYGVDGIYTVSVTGSVTAYNSGPHGGDHEEQQMLVSVESWGDLGFTSMSQAFRDATNLQSVPNHSRGLEAVTDMSLMFYGAMSFNHDIGSWDVSNVTRMDWMFWRAIVFNQDLGNWDVSNVTNMRSMFHWTPAFNQDIGRWNTSKVTDMGSMFNGATVFNQDLGDWDTSNVTTMNSMFWNAEAFNGDIGGWNTEKVTDMNSMFRNAKAFNQDIGSWNTSSVVDMNLMFREAQAFNQDLGDWDVSNVARMNQMFSNTTAFNGDIGGWNTGNVTDMRHMFAGATVFNRNIGGWNTAKVSAMDSMFFVARAFNQDLSGWCVPLIATAPQGFDEAAIAWVLPNSRPIWGTCPGGEAP